MMVQSTKIKVYLDSTKQTALSCSEQNQPTHFQTGRAKMANKPSS